MNINRNIMISDTQYYKRKNQIVLRKIAGENLLIPINQTGLDVQQVYILNETALSVWNKLEKELSLKGLVESLQEDFDGSASEIETHVIELINDLQDAGLIEVGRK